MKYIVILGDGMADKPVSELDGKTPLQVANKPNIDSLAQKGVCGMAITVPNGLKPGSDVANLSVMGYSPLKYYSGRSPLEALSIGVDMQDDDLAVRCNLVTLSNEPNYADKTMVDYSAGEISTEEAKILIDAVQEKLGSDIETFYSGVSYRHCLIRSHSQKGTEYTPPHDISGKVIGNYLPHGLYGEEMLALMQKSYDILKDHPINQRRVMEGKNPANSIWLWGEGSKPILPNFEELRGLKGAVISAVDLLKGIGIAGGMDIIEVEGATGTVGTNFEGKAKACVQAIKDGYDYVYLHMEAPDECGHQGDVQGKIKSIELIDQKVVGYILQELKDEDLRILITPDHPTPLITKTHCSDPIPFVIYDSTNIVEGIPTYNELECEKTGLFLNSGDELVSLFLQKGDSVEDNQLNDDLAVVLSENQDENKQNDFLKDVEIDETSNAEEDGSLETTDKKSKKKKEKKATDGKNKNKKIMWICIAVAIALIIITASLLTPILVINAPKVIIGKAEDFSKQVGDGKKYYYLNKDVTVGGNLTLGLNVDLNDKNLTVNGTLTIKSPKNGEFNLGSIDKKVYQTGGKIVAKKLVVNDVKTLNLMSNVIADEIVFENIANGNVLGGIQANKSFEILGSSLVFENIAFASEVKNISASNSNLVFKKDLKTTINAKNTKIVANANIGNAVLDENCEIRLHGSVYSDFASKKLGKISGGKLVYINETGAYDLIENAKVVWLDKNNNKNGDILNCGEVKYIKWLDTPKKAMVEREGSKIYLLLSNVDKEATKIVLTIDNSKDEIVLTKNNENKYDLTEKLRTVGEHNVKIVLRSNEPEFIKDSEAYFVKYKHTLTLDQVKDAKVSEQDGKYVLKFKAVDYATEYEISLDNNKTTVKSNKPAGEEIVYILSDNTEFKKLLTPGNHLVTIVAKSSQEFIYASEEVIAEFEPIIGKLSKPELKCVLKDGKLNFSWNKVENAVRYELYAITESGKTLLLNTKNTSFTMDYDAKLGIAFIIKAIGEENYDASESVQIAMPTL